MKTDLVYRCATVAIFIFTAVQFAGCSGSLPVLNSDAPPEALQSQAVERIEAFIKYFRTTGDFHSKKQELVLAEQELIASKQGFLKQHDSAGVINSWIRLGHIHRMQGDWLPAAEFYRQAEKLARAERKDELLATALLGWVKVEEPLHQLSSASKHIGEAIKLTEITTDAKLRFEVLNEAAQVETELGNLNAAADLEKRAFPYAKQSPDPLSLFYAYLNRGSIKHDFAEQCDFKRGAGDLQNCYQLLIDARSDYLKAKDIVKTHRSLILVASSTDCN